jgi:hypothetical protein
MCCVSVARSIGTCAVVLVSSGCRGDDKPIPTRHVTAHALVWNGRDQPADGRFASTSSDRLVYIFDAPVDCSAIPRGAFDDAPASGVRLELVVYMRTWAAGARAENIFVNSFGPDGRIELPDDVGRRGGTFLSFTRTDDAFMLVTAPTDRGSRANLRLDIQVLVTRETSADSSSEDDHVIDLSGEADAVLCGDIEER